MPIAVMERIVPSMRGPSGTARLLIALVVGSTVFSDYWQYSRAYHRDPRMWAQLMLGQGPGSEHPRMGLPKIANILQAHAHLGSRHAFTLIDLIGASIAAYLLYGLLQRSQIFRQGAAAVRWVGSAGFVFLLQYYLPWITWHQHTETLASAGILAMLLWLLSVPSVKGSAASDVLRLAGIPALSAAQAFLRADVAIALNIGALVVCLRRRNGFALPRIQQAVASGASILIAAAIHYWLTHAYPEGGPGPADILGFKDSFTDGMAWFPFAVFMIPLVWGVTLSATRRDEIDGPSLALLIGAAIYVAVWLGHRSLQQAELLLPYAVALLPLVCTSIMRLIAQDSVAES